MTNENILERLLRLVDESVKSGRYNSRRDVLVRNGISPGYLTELRGRVEENPKAGLTGVMIERFSRALGVSEGYIITGDDGDASDLVDIYPKRAMAIKAARCLKLPEAAIRVVLQENPGGDPSAMYWFRRIESEAERVAPPADSGSFKI